MFEAVITKLKIGRSEVIKTVPSPDNLGRVLDKQCIIDTDNKCDVTVSTHHCRWETGCFGFYN